jgi:thymidine phosphorylase
VALAGLPAGTPAGDAAGTPADALAGTPAGTPADALAGGRALAIWERMIRAQGGDPAAPLPAAPVRHEVRAPAGGYVRRLDARAVGEAVRRLGAGRARKEDTVSPSAGAVCLRKPGDEVEAGEPVLVLHADDRAALPAAVAALRGAIEVAAAPPAPRPLVVERIG